MREILFRGKKENGGWAYGYLTQAQGFYSIQLFYTIQYEDLESFYCEDKVAPETIGQFTGFADNRNKRIFEGDILRDTKGTVFSKQCKYVVEFSCAFGKYVAVDENGEEISACDFPYLEIIGNIHDNKELLETL